MKLVLDTNIWVSATLWNGSVAQKLLYKLLRENHEIYITKEIIEEYIHVLNKDFNIHDYNEYINIIQKSSTLIETKEKNGYYITLFLDKHKYYETEIEKLGL